MKWYRISAIDAKELKRRFDELKRKVKVSNQIIKFYQNMVREQRESHEELEEIDIDDFELEEEKYNCLSGGFNFNEDGSIPDVDARECETNFVKLNIGSDVESASEEKDKLKEKEDLIEKLNKEIEELKNNIYQFDSVNGAANLEKSILEKEVEDLKEKLDLKNKTKFVFDFYTSEEYEKMSREDLLETISRMTVALKRVAKDCNLKAEAINKASYDKYEFENYKKAAEDWKQKYENLKKEIDACSFNKSYYQEISKNFEQEANEWHHKYNECQKELDKNSNKNNSEISSEYYEKKIKDLTEEIFDLKSYNGNLKAEIDGYKSAKARSKKLYESKIKELESLIDDMKKASDSTSEKHDKFDYNQLKEAYDHLLELYDRFVILKLITKIPTINKKTIRYYIKDIKADKTVAISKSTAAMLLEYFESKEVDNLSEG